MPTQGSCRPLVIDLDGHGRWLSTVLRRREDRAGRLDREADDDRSCPAGDAALDAAGMVGWRKLTTPSSVHPHLIRVILLARQQSRRSETVADFHALYRVDAHHRRRQVCVQLAIDRLAQPWRAHRSAVTSMMAPTDEPALRVRIEQIEFHFLRRCGGIGVRTEERVVVDLGIAVPARTVDGLTATDLDRARRVMRDASQQQNLARHSACRNPAWRFPAPSERPPPR